MNDKLLDMLKMSLDLIFHYFQRALWEPGHDRSGLGMFKTNFGYGRLEKKPIESVIMVIPRRNKVKEARSIWSLILKIV